MRFAPHVLTTEEMKAHKFELGLTLERQEKLAGLNFNNLEVVYDQAARLYEIGKARRAREAALRKRINPASGPSTAAKRPNVGRPN